MLKLLTVFLCSFVTLFTPVKAEEINIQPISYQAETIEEQEFEQKTFLYNEDGIEYKIVLTSDIKAEVQIKYSDGTVDTFTDKYIQVGEVLSIFKGESVWRQFIVGEDGKLTPYIITLPEEGENLDSFIDKLLNKKELVRFASAFFAYLIANLGAIVVFIITTLRNKLKNIDRDTLFKELQIAKDEVEIKLRKEYEAKFDAYQEEIVNTLKSLENKVMGKIDTNEAERKEELRKQTLELEATINAVNKKASIDEILGE